MPGKMVEETTLETSLTPHPHTLRRKLGGDNFEERHKVLLEEQERSRYVSIAALLKNLAPDRPGGEVTLPG